MLPEVFGEGHSVLNDLKALIVIGPTLQGVRSIVGWGESPTGKASLSRLVPELRPLGLIDSKYGTIILSEKGIRSAKAPTQDLVLVLNDSYGIFLHLLEAILVGHDSVPELKIWLARRFDIRCTEINHLQIRLNVLISAGWLDETLNLTRQGSVALRRYSPLPLYFLKAINFAPTFPQILTSGILLLLLMAAPVRLLLEGSFVRAGRETQLFLFSAKEVLSLRAAAIEVILATETRIDHKPKYLPPAPVRLSISAQEYKEDLVEDLFAVACSEALELGIDTASLGSDGWSSPIELARKPREWPISEWIDSPCVCAGPGYVQIIVDSLAETATLVKNIFKRVAPLEHEFNARAPWWLYRLPEERSGKYEQYALKATAFLVDNPLALRPAPSSIPSGRRLSGEQEDSYLRSMAPLIPVHATSPLRDLDPVFWWLWKDELSVRPECFPGALPLTGSKLKEVYNYMRVVIVGGGEARRKTLSALHYQNERSPLVIVAEDALVGTSRFYAAREDACAEHRGDFWHFVPYYDTAPVGNYDYEFEEDEA